MALSKGGQRLDRASDKTELGLMRRGASVPSLRPARSNRTSDDELGAPAFLVLYQAIKAVRWGA